MQHPTEIYLVITYQLCQQHDKLSSEELFFICAMEHRLENKESLNQKEEEFILEIWNKTIGTDINDLY